MRTFFGGKISGKTLSCKNYNFLFEGKSVRIFLMCCDVEGMSVNDASFSDISVDFNIKPFLMRF